MSITTQVQETLADAVGSVIVTPIEQDADSGDYIREIRVFDTSNPAKLVFTLRLASPVNSRIELTAPPNQF